jgi:hypothetical protein
MSLLSPLYHNPKGKAKDCAKNVHESEMDLSGISYNVRVSLRGGVLSGATVFVAESKGADEAISAE